MVHASANAFRVLVTIFLLTLCLGTNGHAAEPIKITVFGDSLTSGYQLDKSAGFAPLLEQLLKSKGYEVKVMNASVAGTTTAEALTRLDTLMMTYPDIVIVQLGYNDFVKGLDITNIVYPNLHKILGRLKQQGVGILLCGATPPHYLDKQYVILVDRMYKTLLKTHRVSFYPNILAKTEGHASYSLADGVHPNANGVKAIVYDVYPAVKALVDWRIKYNAHKSATQ